MSIRERQPERNIGTARQADLMREVFNNRAEPGRTAVTFENDSGTEFEEPYRNKT
jgi:hypothetical protein